MWSSNVPNPYLQNDFINLFDSFGLFQDGQYVDPSKVRVVIEGGKVVVIAVTAGKWVAYVAFAVKAVAVAGTGALSYYVTSKAIKGTWIGEGGLGKLAYDFFHPEERPPTSPEIVCPCSDLKEAIDGIVADEEAIHHIATNKNYKSTARGGPWSPRFERIFDAAGISLDDDFNKIKVAGHKGPHPEEYHRIIHERLLQSIRGVKSEEDCKNYLTKAIKSIAKDIETPGTALNKLVTKK